MANPLSARFQQSEPVLTPGRIVTRCCGNPVSAAASELGLSVCRPARLRRRCTRRSVHHTLRAAKPSTATTATVVTNSSQQPAELRVELETAAALGSITFVDVPNRRGSDIALASVAPGSTAEAAGLRPGQRLIALSDPVRQQELWQLNERASLRFVRDAFRMRRTAMVTLVVTPAPLLLADMQAVEQARSAVLVDSSSSGPSSSEEVSGGWASGSSSGAAWAAGGVEESVRLVGLKFERQPGMTIGQQLEAQYRSARPAVSASQQRIQRRQEYMTQVSTRNDSSFFALVGALVLGPVLLILGIAYGSGYLDSLAHNQFY